MTMFGSRSSWALGMLISFASLAALAGGCADLIGGIGQPPADAGAGGDGPDDGLIEDTDTGVRTTPACIDYCDDMDKNCGIESGFPQYTKRANCVSVCNAYEPGDSEAIGDNLACRAQRAKLAGGGRASESCPDAGPASEACGSKCESWCKFEEKACPSTLIGDLNCEAACAFLPSNVGFNASTMQTGNSIECRIYHVNAGLTSNAEFHCRHAQYWSDEFCIDTEADEINCEVYCQNVAGACRDDVKLYDTNEECLAACGVLAVDNLGEARDGEGNAVDTGENTVSCRTYHASVALNTPEVHCPHAGPTGGGACGGDGVDNVTTGNCDSYCTLYQGACGDDFGTEFAGGFDECRTKCASDLADTGALSASAPFLAFQYFAATATDKDSVQCRVYYAIQAATAKAASEPARAVAACANARLTQVGGCPDRL